MGTVIVLGSIITDLVARAPRLPLPGESLIGDEFALFLGGKGINQAIAAARLGASVTLIGRVGTDAFGDAFFPILKQEGINSAYVTRDPSIATGVSTLIIAAYSGQNMIVVNQGANLTIASESVEEALHAAQAEHVQKQGTEKRAIFLAQCETSSASYISGMQRAHTMGMLTILNAAPIPREQLDTALFSLIDILVVNEVEAAALAQASVTSPKEAQVAAEQLLTRGPRHVIITLGSQGCVWSTCQEKQVVHQSLPAFTIKALDATAAGDAFCGALAACLSENMPMLEALRCASAAGALTATRKGAIAALPTATEVEHLLSTAEQ